ncbi:MAG: alpha/beta hydrolase [Betaproteobacteria bacterium]
MSSPPLSPHAWRAGGGMLEHLAGRIFTKTEGSGRALLLIHGFPTASWDWAKIWPALAARYRCLTLDMIGFGFSAKPAGFAYSIRAQADLFETFLAAQGVTEYAILAHDYGDTVAQELLARHHEGSARQRITRIVLLNGGLFPETHQPLLLQKLLAGPLGPLVARLTTYRKFAANLRAICAQPLADSDLEGMWHLLTLNNGIAVLPKLIGYMAERRTHRARWVGALQESTLPIRLIDGLRDPISGAHMVARYRELISQPDIVELPEVGHYPQVEDPDAVIKAVLEFLGD